MKPRHEPESLRIHKDVVEALALSYFDPAVRLNHLRDCELPSRPKTLRVLSLIKDLLFPDHRLHRQVRVGQTDYIVGGLLEQMSQELERQIYQALLHDKGAEGP